MNLKFHIICLAAVLALVVPAVADNNTARVYGGVYSSETFEPLYNVVVSVNSTPSQYMLAKSGTYIFDLIPGNYSITAKYFDNNTLICSATENITIEMIGSYRHDLLLFPVYSIELMEGSTEYSLSNNLTSSSGALIAKKSLAKTNMSNGVNSPEQNRVYSSNVSYFLVPFTLFLLLVVGFGIFKKHKKKEKNSSLEKTRHTTGDLSRVSKEPEFSVIVQDKNIDPKIRQEFNLNNEKAMSVTETTIELESRSVFPTVELGEESESKVLLSKPIVTLESKISAAEKIMKFESNNYKKKGLKENKEENRADETGLIDTINGFSTSKKQLLLQEDLQEVMEIIKDQGGRVTQKDLRRKLKKYSEGKVSLMLTDLEGRELIKKFKKGRGNIVILNDEEN
jgi:uncharacterized membrane protein